MEFDSYDDLLHVFYTWMVRFEKLVLCLVADLEPEKIYSDLNL